MVSLRSSCCPPSRRASSQASRDPRSRRRQLNVICSVQAEWCNLAGVEFEKETGIKTTMTLKGSGESMAQLAAEKANPKLDVWFGGTGDPHLQAAELGLTEEYKSPMIAQLQPWAQKQAEQAKYRTVGIYLGVLGLGYNTELLAKKKVPAPACWKDLAKPEYADDVQMANPNASGTAYTAIATLVQLFGEEEAFKLLKAMHKNITNYARQGVGPIKAAARGENLVAVAFIHDVVTEAQAGFPVKSVAPCEGHRLRDRLDVDRQGRAQSRQREEIRRLGADAEGAGARRAGEAVPAAVEHRDADLAACRRSRPRSSSSTTISRSTARRPNASGCSSAGTAKSAASRAEARSEFRSQTAPAPAAGAAQWEPPHDPSFRHRLIALLSLLSVATRPRRARSTSIAARPTPPGARGWRSDSRRRPASRSRSCRRRPAKCWRRSRPRRRTRRATSGGRARRTRTCRPPRKDCSRPIDRRTSRSCTTGRGASPRSRRYQVAGVYGGILSLGYNTELGDKRKLPVPKCWKDLLDPALQGRGDARQSRHVGHRVPDARVAGAGVRRGRGVRAT